MREYIIKIDDEMSDESEIFIGYIRRHSAELIHCRDCVWYDTKGCAIDKDDRYSVPVPSDFCSYGEKK